MALECPIIEVNVRRRHAGSCGSRLALVGLVDDDLGMSVLDRGQDLSNTDDPVVPDLVEIEGRRAAGPAGQAALEVLVTLSAWA